MKRIGIVMLLACVALPGVLSTGCGEKAAEITPDKKAQFGTANQPMPPEARESIMKMTQKGQEKPPAPTATAAKP